MNVSSVLMRKPFSQTSSFSVVRKFAAILALGSALTSADALASPGVRTFGARPFQKDSNTEFALIHTNNPLHGIPSGPLHASIDPFDGEAIKQMLHLVQDVPLHVSIDPFDGEAIKEMVHLVGAPVQDVQAAVKDFQGSHFSAVGASVHDVGGLEAPVHDVEGAVQDVVVARKDVLAGWELHAVNAAIDIGARVREVTGRPENQFRAQFAFAVFTLLKYIPITIRVETSDTRAKAKDEVSDETDEKS